jgi:23S rRNA (guanosine2251-2'-O)-methyltransferase
MVRKVANEELGRMSVEEFQQAPKLPLVVVLDNIRSMNNVGSVFRTADAFRISSIILAGITAQPPHREIQKTALGATESVDWTYFESAAEAVSQLKKDGFEIIAVEQTEPVTLLDQFKIDPSKKYALVFGNEVFGVDEKVIHIADRCVEIPQQGTKHSLNVAVSAGIVMWEFSSKLNK